MIRSIGRWLIAGVVVVTIYKAAGGDLTVALNAAWSAVSSVVDSVSDWLLTIPAVRDLLTG